jgi:hypothetical protein
MKTIGGAKPTGALPKDVNSGIFGFDNQANGLFSGGSFRPSTTPDGIFFNPNARTWYEKAEPELGWALERRPGRPLYPGSSAQGLVLVGPSMGTVEGEVSSMLPWAIGAAVGLGLAMLLKRR